MQVIRSRRFDVLIAVVLGSLLLTCSHPYTRSALKSPPDYPPLPKSVSADDAAKYPRAPESFCTSGNGSKSRPMICVDENTLKGDPPTAHVFDVESKGGKPSNVPVTIHWFTQHTADLQITFRDNSCVGPVTCDGAGHCWATVKKLDTPRDADGRPTSRSCVYDLKLRSSDFDPSDTIVVDPCCW
jgi:hypothetical protein